jgi:hypothetical protein
LNKIRPTSLANHLQTTTTTTTNTMKLSIVIAAPLLAAAGVDASLSRCRAACRGGPAAMNRFCRLPIIPFPAKALCWAASNALRTSTGRTYCYNFCYARWGRKRSVDPEDQEFDEYDDEEFEAEEEYAQYLDEIYGGEEPGEVEGAPEAEASPAPEA